MPLPSCDYRFAYGFHIASDLELPELPASDPRDNPDVSIEVGATLLRSEVKRLITPESPIKNALVFEDGYCQILFTEVGRFTVRGGSHILIEPLEGVSPSALRLPLLGSILAMLLEQRSLLALHAGCVEMTGPTGNLIACAFAGDKGQGKSTLGAALSVAGFPLFCDDVLGLTLPSNRSESPVALLGFGSIKLIPDAVSAVLSVDPEELPLVAPELSQDSDYNKRQFLAPVANSERPLRHVFLLASHEDADLDDITLRALAPQEALMLLITHTFAARWGELYLKGAARNAHFKACAQIVASCHVWELSRRRDLKLLPKTIELIATTAREVL
ncbi:hypothetical protein EON83_18025 [bacterium]|nr:MAG: hypothetical protein EON83_18025 [bacterium]